MGDADSNGCNAGRDGQGGHNFPMATERKALPEINQSRCTGCGWCVAVCPPHVLSLAVTGWDKFSQLHDEAGCTGCALCAVKCPFGVIRMVRLPDLRDSC